MQEKGFKKIDIKTRQLVNTLFLGNYKAAFKGRGLEFHDFREYADGDDAKLIDWLVSGREGKTVIRRYREERELEVMFVIDTSHSMYFGDTQTKIDTLKEVFYVLGFSAVKNGDKIGAYMIDGEHRKYIPCKKGSTSLFHVFRSIPEAPGSYLQDDVSLGFLLDQKLKGKLLFVLTDKLKIDNRSLKALGLHNDIVFIHVSDTFENTLEGSGIKILQDTHERISIDLDNTEKKQAYQKMRNEKLQNLKSLLLQHRIDSMFISNHDNVYKKVLQLMRSREI